MLTGLLTGGTLLLFALVFYFVLERNLRGELDARLGERAALLARMTLASGNGGQPSSLPQPAPLVEFEAPGIYAEIIAPDGVVQAASPNLPGGQLPVDATLIGAARAHQTAFATVTVGRDEQLRLMATPLRQPSGAVLVVAESLEPLHRTLQRARSLLLAGSAIALLLALGGATFVTRRALTPVGQLTHAAAQIAATGAYATRVPVPRRRDEVGELAATINELIATVDRTLTQQRQFLADTSHELRSPLTVVLANLDLLRRGLDATDREISLSEAMAEAQKMRRLVNDLLLLAQADAAQAIAHTAVRLDRVLAETTTRIARQAGQHAVRLVTAEPVVVIGDEERLTQLLRNLLENAIHHTPPGTVVEVQLRRSDTVAQIIVADTGPGIATEHLPRLWERFYRVDKARSRSVGGSGLGLAIVKYITEAHGGSVDVTSTPGKGTAFSIALPLAPQHAPMPVHRAQSVSVSRSTL